MVIPLPPPPPLSKPIGYLDKEQPIIVRASSTNAATYIPQSRRRPNLFEEEEQYRPKTKIDLMPSLKKKAQTTRGKQQPCNQCKRSQNEDNLFCNSFCGHLLCFDCSLRGKLCSECSVEVDVATAEQFFRWYCKRCETQNIAKGGDNLCKDCKLEEELHQLKLRKEQ